MNRYMKALMVGVAVFAATPTFAFSAKPYMEWIEANSNLTCTVEPALHWITPGQLRKMSPTAHLGLARDGNIYVVAQKQSDRKKREPIVVHEIVHQCQRDSGELDMKTIDGCLVAEKQAHELDELWRKQRGLKYEPVSAARLLQKCIVK